MIRLFYIFYNLCVFFSSKKYQETNLCELIVLGYFLAREFLINKYIKTNSNKVPIVKSICPTFL